jgi:transposase
MNKEAFANIHDVEKLKEMMASFVSDFSDKEQNYKAEIKILNEQIKSLRDRLFGKKTKKIQKDDGQLSLFDMFEPDTPILDEPEEISVPAHNRKKSGRKPLPENLPQVEVIHDLTEEEKLCASACIYSLIETAKASGLEPYWHLKFLFESLPEVMTADEFKALMPQNLDKNLLESNDITPSQA